MNKGILEREQAYNVKHIVRQTKLKRRQPRIPGTTQDLRPDLESPPVVKLSLSTFHYLNQSNEVL